MSELPDISVGGSLMDERVEMRFYDDPIKKHMLQSKKGKSNGQDR